MEKEKEVMHQIEEDLKIQFLKIMDCDVRELVQVHRSFIETINSYCFYRTLVDKYSPKDSE